MHPPRWLPPKYLYDPAGSRLYEQITSLEEYYPFRAELEILRARSGDLVEAGCSQALVEFGSGSASKTRVLLEAMAERDMLEGYGAIEVSEAALRGSFESLGDDFPSVSFEGVLGDFNATATLPFPGLRRLILFLGSTIGNLASGKAEAFLARVAASMTPRDTFLVGFDLVKDVDVIERAYNDAQGVTAAFNLNVLRRLNRELGADFRLDRYSHRAFFNREESQIEMHLVAQGDEVVSMGRAGFSFGMREGESIRTEISRKFTRSQVQAMARAAGLTLISWHTDPADLFAVALFRRGGPGSGAPR